MHFESKTTMFSQLQFFSSACCTIFWCQIQSFWAKFGWENFNYFNLTAPILSHLQLFQSCQLHIFQANVTGIQTIWLFMFQNWANFNKFNLTAPFWSWVHCILFYNYALHIFWANFTKEWTLSIQLWIQFFPAVFFFFETSECVSIFLHLLNFECALTIISL